MIYTNDPERKRVFAPAETPRVIATMTPEGTVGTWLTEDDLTELIATVQDRPAQLGADSAGDL